MSSQTSALYYVKVSSGGTASWYGPVRTTVRTNCQGRIGQDGPGTSLTIKLAPNPLQNNQLQAIITGAGGQSLTVQFMDMQGRPLREQQWPVAAPAQPISWDVSGQDAGVYLLRATTNGQQQTIKVLKP